MSSLPKISVILPFYNSETTLKRAINSIAAQSFTNFECILIDNNSVDGSVEIAQKVINSDNRFKLVYEKQQGVMFASNKGFEASRGTYVARMDSDDWAHPQRLELQNRFLDNNTTYGAVTAQVKHISHSQNAGGMARFVEWSNAIITYEEILLNQFTEMPIVNPTAMWRRKTAMENGMYRHGDFPEDYEMWLRWLSNGVKIHKLDVVLLNWYDSEGRLSRTNDIYSYGAFYKIKTKYLTGWLKKHNQFYPDVAIWGASKISRRRSKLLENHGINICCYIDTKKYGRQISKKVYYYKDIPSHKDIFVLTYIKQKEAREEVREYLTTKGFVEGINFLVIS